VTFSQQHRIALDCDSKADRRLQTRGKRLHQLLRHDPANASSPAAARLFWPLLTGFLRVLVAIGGGWLALSLTGSLNWLFAALALGLIVYGVGITVAVRSGSWFKS